MMIGWRREAMPLFPANAGVDDTYLYLSIAHKYGLSAVQVEPRTYVYGYFPETLAEWVAQRTRWIRNTDLVIENFPEFQHVLQARRSARKASMVPSSIIDQGIEQAMQAQNIPLERLAQYGFS